MAAGPILNDRPTVTFVLVSSLQSEAAQRLDDLEKLIDEHQEIVEELKRTESSQVRSMGH